MAEGHTEPASLVTHYLQTRAPELAEIHDVWAVETSFNAGKSEFEAKKKHEEFMEALQEYGKLEGRKLLFNPIDCSWKDVFKQLEKAEEAASASEQGDKRFLTNSRRKMNTMSKAIEPLLDAIPKELSILRGGLAIIFYLAQHREKARRDILDTFEEIPGIIAMACSKSQSFPQDLSLHESIDELKVTLFDAIPSLIEVLMPGKFLTKMTCLFRGFRVQDILDCIQRKARGVEAFARNLQDGLVVKSYLATQEVQKTTTSTHVQVREIYEGVTAMDQAVRGLDNRCQEIDSNIIELKDFISKQINDALTSKNGMFQMLKDVVSVFLCDDRQPELIMDPAWITSVPTPEQLLTLLNVPLEQEAFDLEFVLRQSKEFDLTSKPYGATVMSSPRFQQWIAASETDLIYVEGHLDPSRLGKTSPISYFCANLALLLRDSPTSITLHFFCGQHVASNDDLQGPRGLIRSLLSQLLQLWSNAPLDGIDLEHFNGNHELISTEDLCQILELLLGQVPTQTTIFCIIDDLGQFEKDRWDEDYWHFLRMLGTLVVGQESGIKFKALVTSSTKSKQLQEQIPEDLRIQVTERDRMVGHRRQQSRWSAGNRQ
ncbi:hypothetical protein V8E51_017723 [Hyaloscypha variabilis]